MIFRVKALRDHVLDAFRCGKTELDEWLVRHAHNAKALGMEWP